MVPYESTTWWLGIRDLKLNGKEEEERKVAGSNSFNNKLTFVHKNVYIFVYF